MMMASLADVAWITDSDSSSSEADLPDDDDDDDDEGEKVILRELESPFREPELEAVQDEPKNDEKDNASNKEAMQKILLWRMNFRG